jgi:hypothetical protein
LIYRCTACDGTWNRPIVERRDVSALDSPFLNSLQANEPALVRRLAFDVGTLRRWTGRVEEFDDVEVTRHVLSAGTTPLRSLEIDCVVPEPTGVRLDRLLASELDLSRSSIQRLETVGQIRVFPPGSSLRRSLRDGMRLVIDASSMPESSILAAGSRQSQP